MESINIYLQKIEDMLAKMEDVIEGSRSVPFSNKVSLDKHAIYSIIDDIRPVLDDLAKDLPNEITQAKRVISDSDKIINDARNKASMLLQNAQNEVNKMLSDHEISKLAIEQATQLIEESKKSAREMRVNAMEYTDEILAESEQMLRETIDAFSRKVREVEASFAATIDTFYNNRQELRGTKK